MQQVNLQQAKLRQALFYIAGLLFLALAKAKSVISDLSPRSPKVSAPISDMKAWVEDDVRTVENWLSRLEDYTDSANLTGKNVLKLGADSTLGVGLYLLAKGCFQYNACDADDRMKQTPDSFYRYFLGTLSGRESQEKIDFLKQQLAAARAGYPSRLNSLVRDNSDLVSAFGTQTVDLVFSEAAFEHAEDIAATISQLHTVCKPGAVLVAQVDLTRHWPWLGQRDPNNIYRYSKRLYQALWFQGSHNRVRPFEYKEILNRFGWTDVLVEPVSALNQTFHNNRYLSVDQRFANPKNQMDYLSIVICARNSKD